MLLLLEHAQRKFSQVLVCYRRVCGHSYATLSKRIQDSGAFVSFTNTFAGVSDFAIVLTSLPVAIVGSPFTYLPHMMLKTSKISFII